MPTDIPRSTPRKALRVPAILAKTGLSRSSLYRLIKQKKFPKLHKFSERISAGDEAEIDDWLAEKFAGGGQP